MVQVDTTAFQQSLDFLVARILAVDRVLALIVLERRSGDDELRPWNHFEFVGSGLGERLLGVPLPQGKGHTLSMMSRKCTSTLHSSRSG